MFHFKRNNKTDSDPDPDDHYDVTPERFADAHITTDGEFCLEDAHGTGGIRSDTVMEVRE